MAKIIEGLWDCPYCKQSGIGGLSKTCPNCGHPQDKDTQFYMGKKKNYLDNEKAKEYGKGEDWICSFCNNLNRYNVTKCTGCGGSKSDSEETYFYRKQLKQESLLIESSFPEEKKNDYESALQAKLSFPEKIKSKVNTASNKDGPPTIKEVGLSILVFVLIISIVGAFTYFISRPKNINATLSDKTWSRIIAIEEYKTVKESDWSVPDGGRTYETNREVHHYDKKLDHYESHQEQRSRQVPDGFDEHISYHNNGDGTFSENVIRTPRYRTEYYYETVQIPVYKDVPVYRTKYYYEIDKWVPTRDVKTAGHFNEPEWGEVSLKEKERIGSKTESYKLIFKTDKKQYKKKVKEDVWSAFSKNDKVTLTIQTGIITKIDNQEV